MNNKAIDELLALRKRNFESAIIWFILWALCVVTFLVSAFQIQPLIIWVSAIAGIACFALALFCLLAANQTKIAVLHAQAVTKPD
jgi:cytosine/uracil/thiamine/allantoin permease